MAKLCVKCRTKIKRKRVKNASIKAAKRAKELAETKRLFKKALASETLVIWGPAGIGKTMPGDNNHA